MKYIYIYVYRIMSSSFNSFSGKWLSVMSAKNASFFVIAGMSIKIKLPIYRNVDLFEGGVGGGRTEVYI